MKQDYVPQAVRAAAILTNAYVAGTVLDYSNVNPALKNQLNLLVQFTKGSLTSASIKVEYSHDGSTYYQETFENISGATSTLSAGVYTMTASNNYVISLPIKFSYIKVSIIGTGTVTSSSATIDAVVGVA